jgi:hypothetical protein
MSRRVLLAALSLAVALSAACTFGPQYEFDKANPLIDESNKLNADASALLTEALSKNDAIYKEAQKADDPFEELGAQADALKKLEPQIDTAKTKLHDASQKLAEAAKLNVPDFFKQYLSNLSEINKSGSEHAELVLQMVKNTYDPNIKSPEDLDAKGKALGEKMAAGTKRRDELQAANKKIEAEHKDVFK